MKLISRWFHVACALLLFASGADAATFELNPMQDAFTYQFIPTTPFKGAFPNILAVSYTQIVPPGSPSWHETRSLMSFDVASTGLTGSQVASATLHLYTVATESTGFGASPSALLPVPMNATALAPGLWNENTVTWNTMPVTAGGVVGSTTINAVGQWFQIDLTSLVQDWLDGSLANNGLLLHQPGPRVQNGSGTAVASVFDSTNGGAFELFLEITRAESAAVPEPSTWALGVIAGVGLLLAAPGLRRTARWPGA